MRVFLLNIFLLLVVFNSFAQWKSYQIYGNDTINKIDKNGLKQGLWIYFNKYYANGIVQKGYYKDGKKEGVWETYYPNGQLKAKITYKDNRQYGPITIYYQNGNINEQGYWKGNKWVGEYKYFYENGNPMYIWHYDENGKRSGIQKYFYENGKLMAQGNWQNGKEQGIIKEYFQNGNLKRLSHWNEGTLDGEVVEYYADGQVKLKRYFTNGIEDKNKTVFYAKVEPAAVQDTLDTAAQYYRQFTGTGNFKFFDSKGRIISEGYFRRGVLYTGKKYLYNKEGKLIRIIKMKQGQIIDIITPQNSSSNQP